MNVLNDQNIVGLTVLLVINTNNKDPSVIESLKNEMKNQMTEDKLKSVKFHDVDFENYIHELKVGFDWLCDNMKPLQ